MLTDRQVGTLVKADADAALLYAECREKHSGVVAAYEKARGELR